MRHPPQGEIYYRWNDRVEVTNAQDGCEWHVARATCGGITSTVVAKFKRWCQDDLPESARFLLTCLVIEERPSSTANDTVTTS